MVENSMIFGPAGCKGQDKRHNPELIYESKDGYTRISRVVIDGKITVLKSLKPDCAGIRIYEDLLEKEYTIGKGLDHPGICRTLGYENVPGLGNCIILDWVDGESLASVLKSGKIDASSARKIILEICDALDYVHHRQIIHKDIKPENIMITDNGLNVKIIDFGFADTDSYAVLKLAAGTRSYAAPEQISGGKIDERSDIYAFGKVIEDISGCLEGRAKRFWKSIAEKCVQTDPDRRISNAISLKNLVLRRERLRRQIPLIVSLVVAAVAISLWVSEPYIRRICKRHQIDNLVERVTEEILK